MIGLGKYNAEAERARADCGAEGLIIVVFNGKAGHGFEAHLPPEALMGAAAALRDVASQIQIDHAKAHEN